MHVYNINHIGYGYEHTNKITSVFMN